MLKLILFNLILIAIIAAILFVIKKNVKTEKGQNTCLLVASIATIACHYSPILYHLISDGSHMEYLYSNPNLILPIYPCNLIMWCCLIYALIKKKDGKLGNFLADFIFWLGLACCIVGMFANVDFIENPTLANYDTTKSILAHGFMLFNVLLLRLFNRINFDLIRNIKSIYFSVVLMLVVGLYINTVYSVIVSYDTAYEVNSMFIIHSPFAGLELLTYPLISILGLVLYFGLFALIEVFKYPKGNRWYDRLKKNN